MTARSMTTKKAASSNNDDPEMSCYKAMIKDVEQWWKTPRWAGVVRGYDAASVVQLRGTIPQVYPSSAAASKAFGR